MILENKVEKNFRNLFIVFLFFVFYELNPEQLSIHKYIIK